MKCEHEKFAADVDVHRVQLAEGGPVVRFQADVRITCMECNTPFRFIGLPAGVDLNGASTAANGEEGRFAVAPRGEVLCALEGAPVGFTVRKVV